MSSFKNWTEYGPMQVLPNDGWKMPSGSSHGEWRLKLAELGIVFYGSVIKEERLPFRDEAKQRKNFHAELIAVQFPMAWKREEGTSHWSGGTNQITWSDQEGNKRIIARYNIQPSDWCGEVHIQPLFKKDYIEKNGDIFGQVFAANKLIWEWQSTVIWIVDGIVDEKKRDEAIRQVKQVTEGYLTKEYPNFNDPYAYWKAYDSGELKFEAKRIHQNALFDKGKVACETTRLTKEISEKKQEEKTPKNLEEIGSLDYKRKGYLGLLEIERYAVTGDYNEEILTHLVAYPEIKCVAGQESDLLKYIAKGRQPDLVFLSNQGLESALSLELVYEYAGCAMHISRQIQRHSTTTFSVVHKKDAEPNAMIHIIGKRMRQRFIHLRGDGSVIRQLLWSGTQIFYPSNIEFEDVVRILCIKLRQLNISKNGWLTDQSENFSQIHQLTKEGWWNDVEKYI